MTIEPDPAELAPSRDPAAYGRKPLLGFGFWLSLFFCLVFAIGGYALARFGPRLFPERPAQPRAETSSPSTPSQAAAARAPPAVTPPRPAGPAPAGGATVAAAPADATIEARVQRLEGAEDAVVRASAVALATAQLSQAAATSRPFADELAAVRALMPASADAALLTRHAAIGAPSRAALAAEFQTQIQPVAIAVRAPGPEAGLLAHIGYALSSIVTVRRIGPDERGREEQLSRIERLVREGDLEGALTAIDTLPGAARDQLSGWRRRAERRVEVDRSLTSLRAQALADLVRVGGAHDPHGAGPDPHRRRDRHAARPAGRRRRGQLRMALPCRADDGGDGDPAGDGYFAAGRGALAHGHVADRVPRRAARYRAEVRRRQGLEALARGFVAAAAGDGADARRLAQRAANLAEDAPVLVRILNAQAAEAAGDTEAARGAYSAMLGLPDLRLAGHRGLMQIAIAEQNTAEALRHAQAAYSLARTARWAWRALLEARLSQGDWAAALDLVKSATERKILPPVAAERARAALLAANAAGLEASPEAKDRAQALSQALEAVKLRPDFAPGAVMAARLLATDGKGPRAAQVIEQAWRAAAHPALWLAYRDLNTAETPPERADRLARLANLNAHAREARILTVEQALISGDPGAAQTAVQTLEGEAVTQRLAGLFARVAGAAGKADEARAWVARGLAAPQEPDWSDLDPEGKAFNYTPADWARLVATYAETGELIHPRHERAERTMSDLPQLPSAYAASTPFVTAAAASATPALHDAGYEEDWDLGDSAPAPPGPATTPAASGGGGASGDTALADAPTRGAPPKPWRPGR